MAGSLKLQYESRICKTGDQGYDLIKLCMRFESAACTTTLVDFHTDDYWPNVSGYHSMVSALNAYSGGRFADVYGPPSMPNASFKWAGFNKPVLNLALKDIGLSQEQSAAVVKALFEKLMCAFEGSGLYEDPCELYIRFLLDLEAKWGQA